ncbi:hypothetical protein RhiirA1_535817 [Rhizophagus irregularis]|uniref:Uncharacterized protein n=1 Tax=Rhizophagus irregularis TaxID=588596 RepID=A0A2N0RS95_9GLOM|nr:hypothetical protein RhiirA1_535817 [Rhizophagus irregularis]CAB4489140.1 unnamed protein product [Rhizophagus irregularis]
MDNFFKGPSERNSTNLFEKWQKSDKYNETDIEENEAVHELHDDLDTSDHEETADEEEEVVETTDNKKVKKNKNRLFRLSEKHQQIVKRVFNGMKKGRMWRLSTEKYVKKKLFELGKKLEFEQSFLFLNAVHSFIVDVDDVIIKQHFSKTELDEIDDAPSSQIPELLDEIVEFLSKFDYKTKLSDIRDIIRETMFDGNYNHEKDNDNDKDYTYPPILRICP